MTAQRITTQSSKPAKRYVGYVELVVTEHADLDGLARFWTRGAMNVTRHERDGDRARVHFEWTGKGGHPSDMRRRVNGYCSTTVRPSVATYGVLAYVRTEAKHLPLDAQPPMIHWPTLLKRAGVE